MVICVSVALPAPAMRFNSSSGEEISSCVPVAEV
jgi:hypothetical protein